MSSLLGLMPRGHRAFPPIQPRQIWAGWIQGNSSDFAAIAQLGRVKALIQRVADLDPEHANWGAFLYLGVFETLLPPAMGGRPEMGRRHFERALTISNERNLIVKVMMARSICSPDF